MSLLPNENHPGRCRAPGGGFGPSSTPTKPVPVAAPRLSVVDPNRGRVAVPLLATVRPVRGYGQPLCRTVAVAVVPRGAPLLPDSAPLDLSAAERVPRCVFVEEHGEGKHCESDESRLMAVLDYEWAAARPPSFWLRLPGAIAGRWHGVFGGDLAAELVFCRFPLARILHREDS